LCKGIDKLNKPDYLCSIKTTQMNNLFESHLMGERVFLGVDFPGKTICGNFAGADFKGCNFADGNFINSNFAKCNFTDVNFSKAQFFLCTFEGCNFTNAIFNKSFIHRTSFANCVFIKCSLQKADLLKVTF